MISLHNGDLDVLLHEPSDGYYQGTRFDRSGVFGGIRFRGVELCDQWFERYDPFMHDAVLGPAEEFTPQFLSFSGNTLKQSELSVGVPGKAPELAFLPDIDSCGAISSTPTRTTVLKDSDNLILKIGVGLLKPDGQPYDRFRRYEIIDPGEWSMEQEGDDVRYRHTLRGYYIYNKEVRVLSGNSFEISHELTACDVPLKGEVYNHNFFTLGLLSVGPGREITFPCPVTGDWRAQYDSIALAPEGFRFSRTLQKGESVYMGNIRAKDVLPSRSKCFPPEKRSENTSPTPAKDVFCGTPYEFILRETGLAGIIPTVHVRGNVPITHSVMWSNHRIACFEPYNAYDIGPGESFRWIIRYALSL